MIGLRENVRKPKCIDKVINVTRYSLVTGRLQKMLNQKVAEEKQIIARRVKEGHNGSLVEFTDISGEN